MTYLPWSIPVLVAIGALVAGRSSTVAGLGGFASALLVALALTPDAAGIGAALLASARGAWLAVLVGAVIFGGLFFREVTLVADAAAEPAPVPADRRRRHVFAACFLVGPFAEAATGFGVGQVAVAPTLRRLQVPAFYAVVFGLFSQTMVPWGALANGTIVGAAASDLAPTVLGVHSALLTVPLLFAWLGLFWRFAAAAGMPGSVADFAGELACAGCMAVLLVACNALMGPEVAGLAALGPVIVVRYLLLETPTPERRRHWARIGLPYLALIVVLAGTRVVEPLHRLLGGAVAIRPFADGAILLPLLHPATWLVLVGASVAVAAGRPRSLRPAAARAWSIGRRPVLTIMLFLAMAELIVAAGAAHQAAAGLRALLGDWAALATPLLAGLFGFLTSSSNAANGLLMPAQAALALQIGIPLPWLAAVQNVGAACMTMLSPVRVAMGCAQVGEHGLEREVYARAWVMCALPMAILFAAAGLLVVLR